MNTYTADATITEIAYNVGAPTLKSPIYSFVEDPACFYPETVTLTGLPDFVTHNEDSKDFTIERVSDMSLEGTYQAQITSKISMPTSAVDPTPIIMTTDTVVEFVLVDPSRSSEMLEWSQERVEVEFDAAEPLVVNLQPAKDQSSLDFGNGDGISLCGP